MRPHRKNCGCEIVTILLIISHLQAWLLQANTSRPASGWCGRCSTSAHSVPYFLRYVLQTTRCSGRERPERQFADFSLREFLIAYWYYSQARRLPHHELHFLSFSSGWRFPGNGVLSMPGEKGFFLGMEEQRAAASIICVGLSGRSFF